MTPKLSDFSKGQMFWIKSFLNFLLPAALLYSTDDVDRLLFGTMEQEIKVLGPWFQLGSEMMLHFLTEKQEVKSLRFPAETNSVGLTLSVLHKFAATKPCPQNSLVLCLSLTDQEIY